MPCSIRVRNGAYVSGKQDTEGRVTLVSDQVRVTIEPLSFGSEKGIISEALEKIASGDKSASNALAQLRYLAKLAARAELI